MELPAQFKIEGYDPLKQLFGPGALVLLGGVVAAVHAPQAWNGRNVKALASVAMGMSVAIAAIVSAALEWSGIQQHNASVQAHIDGLNFQLEQANENQQIESAELNQQLGEQEGELVAQATTIEELTGQLKRHEENLSEKTRLAQELGEKHDALLAENTELAEGTAKLNQQLGKLEGELVAQASATKKLTGQLKRHQNSLSTKTRLAQELGEKIATLCAENESLKISSTELEQQLAEARGRGTGKKSTNIQKEVLKTEETFLTKMTELRDLLDKWREADSITEPQLRLLSKGLDEVIKYAASFIDKGVEAYYDIEFMKKYYASLTTMVMNLKSVGELLKTLNVKEHAEAGRLFSGPMQRVGRHRMLFEELLKTSPTQKALKELKTLADWVNTSQRCNEELVEIQDLLGVVVKDRGSGKQTNLVDCAKNLVSIKAKDLSWMEYWFEKPKDLNVSLMALVDKLSYAANIIQDKQILKQIHACALCLSGIISSDRKSEESEKGDDSNDNNSKSPTESLLKLVKDKIARCG